MADKSSGSGQAKIPTAEAMELAEMIQYADGSIVSRTLAENAGGTITLFAFDADQGVSEHSGPYDALVQVLDGQAEFTVGGEKVTVPAGQIMLMPGDVPHAVRAPERFKMILTMLRT